MAFKDPHFFDGSSSNGNSWLSSGRIYRTYGVELVFVIAFAAVLLFGGFSLRPAWHLVGATVLLDILLWRRARPFTPTRLSILVLLNVICLVIILIHHPATTLWVSGFYGLTAILLAVLL